MSETILVVDDDKKIREMCSIALKRVGYEVFRAKNAQEALQIVDTSHVDLALLDIVMPEIDGIDLLGLLKDKNEDLIVIMITGFPSIETSVKTIKNGAYDYIIKPFSINDIRCSVKIALEYHKTIQGNVKLNRVFNQGNNSVELIGESPNIKKIFKIIDSVCNIDCTVLIEGESGTGKEVIARTIHKNSKQSDKPFIAINCGALPETLLESELFGYEKGAFTGAERNKIGLFEAANGGTIFLDEIAETSMALQVKLLRVIEERAVKRIGSTKTIQLDFRLLAATNKKLLDEVKKGNFREDLYYRLNVIAIDIPPLRERKQDIPIFLEHFINHFSNKHSKRVTGFSKEAMEFLLLYDFPGNIRELANIVERAVILSKHKIIQKKQIPAIIGEKSLDLNEDNFNLNIVEKNHIQKVFKVTKNNKSKTAKLLGIDRKTLYLKLRKFGIF